MDVVTLCENETTRTQIACGWYQWFRRIGIRNLTDARVTA